MGTVRLGLDPERRDLGSGVSLARSPVVRAFNKVVHQSRPIITGLLAEKQKDSRSEPLLNGHVVKGDVTQRKESSNAVAPRLSPKLSQRLTPSSPETTVSHRTVVQPTGGTYQQTPEWARGSSGHT